MKRLSGTPTMITADPSICHGQPVFRGTRVMVWQVLELVEAGTPAAEIYQAYPSLPQGAVELALHFATEKVKNLSYVTASDHASTFMPA